MKQLNTSVGTFGGFSNIETLSDRYRCDGVDYQFSVVGSATIEDYIPPVPVAPTPPALTVQDFADAVQKHLDDTAKSRGYAGILSAVSYVGDADPVFNAEGTALKAWRSEVWNACHVKLAEVNSVGVPPTIPELIAILPAVVW